MMTKDELIDRLTTLLIEAENPELAADAGTDDKDDNNDNRKQNNLQFSPYLRMRRLCGGLRFVGQNETEDAVSRHIYEIRLAKVEAAGGWLATCHIDERQVLSVGAATKNRAEKCAVAAFHRYVKTSARRRAK